MFQNDILTFILLRCIFISQNFKNSIEYEGMIKRWNRKHCKHACQGGRCVPHGYVPRHPAKTITFDCMTRERCPDQNTPEKKGCKYIFIYIYQKVPTKEDAKNLWWEGFLAASLPRRNKWLEKGNRRKGISSNFPVRAMEVYQHTTQHALKRWRAKAWGHGIYYRVFCSK